MTRPTPSQSGKTYWLVPRSSANLFEILTAAGYTLDDRIGEREIASTIYDKQKIPVGRITTFDGSSDVSIFVKYNSRVLGAPIDLDQVTRALNLSDFLTVNNLSFKEEPSRSAIIEGLDTAIKPVTDLIKRLQQQ